MWQRIRTYLKQRKSQDALISLIQVADETPEIKAHLILILSQPVQQRSELISRWISDLKEEGAPDTLVELLALLEDQQLAEQTLLTLNRIKKQ